LSKILRYLLYETGSELITIEKEIKILTDYIDLEKLRYSESVVIDFKHEIDDSSEMIPPLLLLPLVENAFKHGVSISRGKRFVEVNCTLQKRKLDFTVRNASSSTSEYRESEDNIGLSNLRRRLSLIYRDFQFTAERKDSIFIVKLNIDLLSHV
jgi:LytS/YehU family sensor histidine kinase